MKNFLKSFLLIFTLSIPALADEPVIEQDKYDLTCDVGAMCLEQSLQNPKHDFHIQPGSVVRVEVRAKNGASITLNSGGNTMSASYLAVGNKEAEKQNVQLEANVDKTGNFALDVQVTKITVNGKPQNADGGAYNLKITRTGAGIHEEVPGESI